MTRMVQNTIIRHCQKPTERTASRVNPNVKYGLGVIMCQCRTSTVTNVLRCGGMLTMEEAGSVRNRTSWSILQTAKSAFKKFIN